MNLREELTTKIHSDFYCSKEDDIRNRMFALLTSAKNDDEKIKEYLKIYQLSNVLLLNDFAGFQKYEAFTNSYLLK